MFPGRQSSSSKPRPAAKASEMNISRSLSRRRPARLPFARGPTVRKRTPNFGARHYGAIFQRKAPLAGSAYIYLFRGKAGSQ